MSWRKQREPSFRNMVREVKFKMRFKEGKGPAMLRAKRKSFQVEEPACGKTSGGQEFGRLQELEGG